jgi:hypothetical protein
VRLLFSDPALITALGDMQALVLPALLPCGTIFGVVGWAVYYAKTPSTLFFRADKSSSLLSIDRSD